MRAAIIILNYNGLKETLECLESIRKLKKDKLETEIIMIDNNSTDGSPEALAKIKDINFIQNDRNLGFSAGNNIGIKQALKINSDLVLIVNNDTIVDSDLLINLTKASKSFDIISSKIYFAKGFEFHKNLYKKEELGKVIWFAGAIIDWDNILGKHIGVDEVDKGQFSKPQEVDFATGACMLVKREVFEKIGYFDERYFLYLEDMDFCVRAKRLSFKIGYEPSAVIWHKNAASTGGSGSKLQDYYFTKSRLLFAFKFAKFKTKLAVLREIITSGNKIKRKAFFDFITMKFGETELN